MERTYSHESEQGTVGIVYSGLAWSEEKNAWAHLVGKLDMGPYHNFAAYKLAVAPAIGERMARFHLSPRRALTSEDFSPHERHCRPAEVDRWASPSAALQQEQFSGQPALNLTP